MSTLVMATKMGSPKAIAYSKCSLVVPAKIEGKVGSHLLNTDHKYVLKMCHYFYFY